MHVATDGRVKRDLRSGDVEIRSIMGGVLVQARDVVREAHAILAAG